MPHAKKSAQKEDPIAPPPTTRTVCLSVSFTVGGLGAWTMVDSSRLRQKLFTNATAERLATAEATNTTKRDAFVTEKLIVCVVETFVRLLFGLPPTFLAHFPCSFKHIIWTRMDRSYAIEAPPGVQVSLCAYSFVYEIVNKSYLAFGLAFSDPTLLLAYRVE